MTPAVPPAALAGLGGGHEQLAAFDAGCERMWVCEEMSCREILQIPAWQASKLQTTY